jgi:hypothetical protein
VRTRRLIEIARQGESESSALGYVIACGESADHPEADIDEAKRLSREKGFGAVSSRSFPEPLGNGYTFRGLAIGLATEAAADPR